MAEQTFTFRVPGKAMTMFEGSAISNDPRQYDGGSKGAVDACAALLNAEGRRAGRHGYTYVVTATGDGAETIKDYCLTVGETFMGESESDIRADGRALLLTADRITEVLMAPWKDKA